MSADEDKHPHEYMAEENQNNVQRKRSGGAEPPPAKASKQTTLGFKTTATNVASDDDDDDDGFNFMQHKPKVQDKATTGKFTATDGGDGDGASASSKPAPKKKPPGDGRILIRSKWPRGKRPLPIGWSASEYKIGGKEKWIFSHPLYGESQNEKHVFGRTEDDWREAMRSRRRSSGGASSSAGSGKAKASEREDPDDEDGEGEECGAGAHRSSSVGEVAEEGDDLFSLLDNVQKKEERNEAMRERVHAEMSMRLDTGVRVNPALRKMFGS